MASENEKSEGLSLSKEDLEALFESTFNASMENDEKDSRKTPLFDGSFARADEVSKSNSDKSQVENFKTKEETPRSKTSLRMKYEAEVVALKKTSGDLEDIRRQLGLSKRKMAQLLMVDPSAWTRWTNPKGEAPPHIYRALEWYLLLQDKNPEFKSAFWLNSVSTPSLSAHEIENIKREVVRKAQESLDLSVPYIEAPTVNLLPLKKQLKSSQTQVRKLSQRLQWLIVSQIILLGAMVLMIIF